MATDFMNRYRCLPEDAPEEFFRVQYPGSGTTFSATEGLVASDTTTNFSQLDQFREAVANHFTWHSRGESPFIAVFSDRDHAENWACREPWHGLQDREWSIYIVEAARLENVYVFKLETLAIAMGIRIPPAAAQHLAGAFLCLHRVPRSSIVRQLEAHFVKVDRYSWRYDICYPPDDYSGSDSEVWAGEYNRNGDLIRGYEDDNW